MASVWRKPAVVHCAASCMKHARQDSLTAAAVARRQSVPAAVVGCNAGTIKGRRSRCRRTELYCRNRASASNIQDQHCNQLACSMVTKKSRCSRCHPRASVVLRYSTRERPACLPNGTVKVGAGEFARSC